MMASTKRVAASASAQRMTRCLSLNPSRSRDSSDGRMDEAQRDRQSIPTGTLANHRFIMISHVTVRRQRSLDRPGGLNKGEFLAHRNVHRSEDETANPSIEGTS